MKKGKKEPCGQRIGWTAAGILWWMGDDGGSDAELFRDEIVNLIQLDLQRRGQLSEEQQLRFLQQGGAFLMNFARTMKSSGVVPTII